MEKYKSYKTSGVEWIGHIPINWNISKYKYNLKILSGFPFKSELFDSEKGFPLLRIRDITSGSIETYYNGNFDGKYIIKRGDVVIGMDGDFNIREWDNEDILLNQRCCKIQEYNGLLLKFIYYTLPFDLKIINDLTYYTTVKHLSVDDLYNIKCVIPPISEQTKIVQFLDEKTELVDKLISTKERKINLLKEQRTSLINHVVTKGLNPNVKMKDSGVECIGEIPEHWMISKFKFDTSSPVQYGLNISGDKYKEEGIRFIRITDLTEEGELIQEDGKYLEENEVPSEFFLNKWDVLFCRSGHTVGKSYLHKEDGKFTSGGYLVRFNFRNYFESKFVFYIGKTSFYWDWIKLNSVVSTIENVNGDKYQNFQYPKPSIQEQQSIVEFLDKRTEEIDNLVRLEQNKINLLKEYRQSLISEVVTGKIKVTTD